MKAFVAGMVTTLVLEGIAAVVILLLECIGDYICKGLDDCINILFRKLGFCCNSVDQFCFVHDENTSCLCAHLL